MCHVVPLKHSHYRLLASHTNIPLAGHAVFSPQRQCGERKHTARAMEVMLLLKATENETLNFIKKQELEEDAIYSFKPIEDVKL